jgi:hypothetical protein
MITLPQVDTYFPFVRMLVMPPGHWTDDAQPWVILPICTRSNLTGSKEYGYELLNCERACLPEIGRAQFFYRYGLINDKPAAGKATALPPPAKDLIGYHVRIQGAEDTGVVGAAPMWRTLFLGTVDSQTDAPWPSSGDAGQRTYHCSDLLYRTARWPLCHHSVYSQGKQYTHCFGHPGYNYSISGYYRRLFGNKGSSTVDPFGDFGTGSAPENIAGYQTHAQTGAIDSSIWKDLDVVLHALHSSRAKGEPIFTIANSGNLNSNPFCWPVRDGEKCWDLLCRVLARQRGLGVSFLDWDDDLTGDPTSIKNIIPKITVNPQNYNDIFYKTPSSGPAGPTVTIVGASSSAINVDLIGDQRFVDDSLQLTINDSTGLDYLETYGEPIECLVTLTGTDGTLEKRWTDADELAFKALTTFYNRQSSRWRQVFQRWSLPKNWDFKVGDGDGGSKTTCYFYTTDVGAIAAKTYTDGVASTSTLSLKIGCDIPIYEGYNYLADAKSRYDKVDDYLCPPRCPPLILLRNAANKYANGAEDIGLGMQVDDFGVYVQYGPDAAQGTRYFSGPGGNVGGSGYKSDDLVISIGLTFGHRVRMASSNSGFNETTAGRKLYLYLPGVHLWLAHPSAIWEHNKFTATDQNAPAKRNAAGGAGAVPGIIRDDRDALAVAHAMAWSWYGTRRTSGKWALRDCGLLPDFGILSGDNAAAPARKAYPKIGLVVNEMYASGHVSGGTPILLRTPITRIHYDHVQGVTTWFTDWQDLDTENL